MVDDTYMTETVICKKCNAPHRVDAYRDVKFYVCPLVNRVLLLSGEEKKDETVCKSSI